MNLLLDQYLLFRVRKRRDREAFAQIYDRYVQPIYRFVYLKLPTKEMAEDVTSEVFLAAWRYLQGEVEIHNLRALLYRIARNLVVDYHRKEGVKKDRTVTFDSADPSTLSEGELTDRSRGRSIIEARADMALVLERISRLKEDYHDVLILRLIDGLSFADIAQVLDKTPGNVRVIYHRAMKALDQLIITQP